MLPYFAPLSARDWDPACAGMPARRRLSSRQFAPIDRRDTVDWRPISTFTEIDGIAPVLVSDRAHFFYATCSADDGWHDETVGDEDDSTVFGVVKWMPVPAP